MAMNICDSWFMPIYFARKKNAFLSIDRAGVERFCPSFVCIISTCREEKKSEKKQTIFQTQYTFSQFKVMRKSCYSYMHFQMNPIFPGFFLSVPFVVWVYIAFGLGTEYIVSTFVTYACMEWVWGTDSHVVCYSFCIHLVSSGLKSLIIPLECSTTTKKSYWIKCKFVIRMQCFFPHFHFHFQTLTVVT